MCALLFTANWERSDRSNDWQHRDQWRAALLQMDRRRDLRPGGGQRHQTSPSTSSTWRALRPDVTVIVPSALWTKWYADLIPYVELRRVAEGTMARDRRRTGSETLQGPGVGAGGGGVCEAAGRALPRAAHRVRAAWPDHFAAPYSPYFLALGHGLIGWSSSFLTPNAPRLRATSRPCSRTAWS